MKFDCCYLLFYLLFYYNTGTVEKGTMLARGGVDQKTLSPRACCLLPSRQQQKGAVSGQSGRLSEKF
jgi:hypothetical protein